MEFIDLAAQQKRIIEKIESNIKSVLNHGKFIMGPEIQNLEENLAKYVGARHAISCASGTDALLMALMAYNIRPGDAVFTTPFTFIATAEVITLLGATPVFVDVDPETFNIDPKKLENSIVRQKNSGTALNPKAVIPVDLFGLLADYESIESIAHEHDLLIIEDGAQSFGAEYKGKKSCSFGSVACTSFFPAKPLGCYGDGGMCFTNDNSIAEILRSVRVHGQGNHKYENIRIGVNGRLDTLQAAILNAKFDIFPDEIERRQKVAKRYSDLLSTSPAFKVPHIPEGYKSAWAQYSVLAANEKQRSILQERLQKANIPTAIYYPKPLHLQKAFADLGYKKGDFPVSEDVASRIFSLPMHPYLTLEDQETIAAVLNQ
ncbi:DegT/DnrJ/EryC1/StrS family aminotransferase [bacterium]|nr:DegT/DnrJ/EryC1/StrS family aminotransferase [candidate division CSSED10-310 bacterium]